MIRQKTENSPAPSMRAAHSRSGGSVATKPRMIQIVTGITVVRFNTTIGGTYRSLLSIERLGTVTHRP